MLGLIVLGVLGAIFCVLLGAAAGLLMVAECERITEAFADAQEAQRKGDEAA